MNEFLPAQNRDITSLQNWVNGTGSIARAESGYLDNDKDLLTFKSSDDGPLLQLEEKVAVVFIQLFKGFYRVCERERKKKKKLP